MGRAPFSIIRTTEMKPPASQKNSIGFVIWKVKSVISSSDWNCNVLPPSLPKEEKRFVEKKAWLTYHNMLKEIFFLPFQHFPPYPDIFGNALATVPFPFRTASNKDACSRIAACKTSKTARQPSMAASNTRSSVSKSGNRASHCDKTRVPRCGNIAHGKFTAGCPPYDDSSLRFKSTRVVAELPPEYPAEHAHSMSLMGIPASTKAREAALMAAQSLPPSSAKITTLTTIRDFGYDWSNIAASNARFSMWDISINRLSVLGFVTLRSPDGAKGAALTDTSTMARSGNSSDRRMHAIGPRTVAKAIVNPISTKALPHSPPAIGLIWMRIRRISLGLRPSSRKLDKASKSVRRIDDPMAVFWSWRLLPFFGVANEDGSSKSLQLLKQQRQRQQQWQWQRQEEEPTTAQRLSEWHCDGVVFLGVGEDFFFLGTRRQKTGWVEINDGPRPDPRDGSCLFSEIISIMVKMLFLKLQALLVLSHGTLTGLKWKKKQEWEYVDKST